MDLMQETEALSSSPSRPVNLQKCHFWVFVLQARDAPWPFSGRHQLEHGEQAGS